jgi:hypothetical protein
MPRKSGTSGSVGGRRKRGLVTGTSLASYPTAGSGRGPLEKDLTTGTAPAAYRYMRLASRCAQVGVCAGTVSPRRCQSAAATAGQRHQNGGHGETGDSRR